jgi:hypothetical protein
MAGSLETMITCRWPPTPTDLPEGVYNRTALCRLAGVFEPGIEAFGVVLNQNVLE